mgnify:FL=1
MHSKDLILLNFSEIRRRSIKLWSGIPDEYLHWKPDEKAFTIIEMIRHVLEGEHLFHKIIENKGNLGDYESPWKTLEFTNLKNELEFSQPYRNLFFNMIKGVTALELETVRIERKEVNQSKTLGDYLNRIAYHESVHTGQLLSYLRTIGIERPQIWD